MNWCKRMLAAAALLLLLAVPALAGLFDGLTTVEGTIGAVNSNHFILLAPNNQIVRVMLPVGVHMPDTLVAGAKVRVDIFQDAGKQWILEEVEVLQGISPGTNR